VRFPMVLMVFALASCPKRTVSEVADGIVQDQGADTSAVDRIVFVPGIMGSELHDPTTGQVVWGQFGTGAPHPNHDPEDMRLLALPWLEDDQAAVTDEVAPGGTLLSGSLRIGKLKIRARGYPGVFEGLIGELAGRDTKHHKIDLDDADASTSAIDSFGYDWRRDISSEAVRLHEEILERGAEGPVDLVGHSMGTLVVRWWLAYGPSPLQRDGSIPVPEGWDPKDHVRQVLLVAPPTLGQPSVFEKLLHGEVVSAILPKYTPAMIATYPALFGLMSRPADERVLWEDGEVVDFYDPAIWREQGWGAYADDQDEYLQWLMPGAAERADRLARLDVHMQHMLRYTRNLHEALDAPRVRDYPPVHVFIGTDHKTQGVLEVQDAGKTKWLEMFDGDGTVDRRSAEGRSARQKPERWTSVHFVRGEHMGIVGETGFLEDALYLLLESGG